MTFPLPKSQRFWLLCFALYIAVNLGVRITLITAFLHTSAPDLGTLLPVIGYGLINDIAIASLLSFPIFMLLFVCRKWWQTRVGVGVAFIIFFGVLCLLSFTALAELIFWNEFDSRFNTTAVYYLIFPREVLGNIRESFDLSLLLPPVFISAFLLLILSRKWLVAALREVNERATSLKPLGVALILGCIGGIYLYFGPVHASQNRELNEVAENGYHTFLGALIQRNTKYHGVYPSMDKRKAAKILQNELGNANERFLSLNDYDQATMRHVTPSRPLQKKNVVLVIEESFGSVYFDDNGPKVAESISPNFHKLAKEGLYFSNVYSTGDRTVRGLEALLTSFAPIPGISTVRRPEHDGMYSLPWVLGQQGYETTFLYAGHSGFDNMRQYWESIGYDHVLEQDDIQNKGFETVWGVADEYLFEEAIKRMDAKTQNKKPVFLSLLTTTNHRPFTYPKGRIKADPDEKKRENSATYADWSNGQFIEQAKKKPWFKDTVFIFIGDHGPKVFGSESVPIQAFRVPLVFYAPGFIEPAKKDITASSLDVAPTLLSLLGIEYDNPFFGQDLLQAQKGNGHASMSYNFTVAYVEGNKAVVLKANTPTENFIISEDYKSLSRTSIIPPRLEKKAIAQTQTAYDLYYNHKYHVLNAH
ncbi:LTA synthase family protein [Terasakiella pusilla]|uniref:LTA synthase family protein n=1 Tax=Terasakiella pusilla TaxID=64973 RepID=UPI003AA8E2B6